MVFKLYLALFIADNLNKTGFKKISVEDKF